MPALPKKAVPAPARTLDALPSRPARQRLVTPHTGTGLGSIAKGLSSWSRDSMTDRVLLSVKSPPGIVELPTLLADPGRPRPELLGDFPGAAGPFEKNRSTLFGLEAPALVIARVPFHQTASSR